MEEEIWKDIPGYEGYYQVSSLGRVKSLPRWVRATFGSKQYRPGRILKNKKSRGYNAVCLCKGRGSTYKRVGRLVAEVFIPNPENLPQVNHKDCNCKNDRVDNLEWCDAKYNCNYADHNKKLSESAKRRFQDPEQYRILVETRRKMSMTPEWKRSQHDAQLNNKNSKPVDMLDMDGNYLKTFPSAAEVFRQMGIHAQNVGQCCLGRKHSIGGYKWRYKNI